MRHNMMAMHSVPLFDTIRQHLLDDGLFLSKVTYFGVVEIIYYDLPLVFRYRCTMKNDGCDGDLPSFPLTAWTMICHK